MNFTKSTVGLFKRVSTGIAMFGLLVIGMFYLTSKPAARAETPSVSLADSASRKCTDRVLRGEYAVRGDGWVPNGPPGSPMVPFANVSLMTLDGAGNLVNDITVSRNGQISQNLDIGTYSVEGDCKGTMTINIATPPFQLTFDLVVADGGNEFVFIATTPSVVTHEAKRLK